MENRDFILDGDVGVGANLFKNTSLGLNLGSLGGDFILEIGINRELGAKVFILVNKG